MGDLYLLVQGEDYSGKVDLYQLFRSKTMPSDYEKLAKLANFPKAEEDCGTWLDLIPMKNVIDIDAM